MLDYCSSLWLCGGVPALLLKNYPTDVATTEHLEAVAFFHVMKNGIGVVDTDN